MFACCASSFFVDPFFHRPSIQRTFYIFIHTMKYVWVILFYISLGGKLLGQRELIPTNGQKPLLTSLSDSSQMMVFSKWELGVQLPDSLAQAIRRFVTKFPGDQKKINPYLSWEVEVLGRFWQKPDRSDLIEIPGFYMLTFEVVQPDSLPSFGGRTNYTDEEYMQIGEWVRTENGFPFRIRFAPPAAGYWRSDCLIRLPDTILRTNEVRCFVQPSHHPGNLKVANNKRFLARGDTLFFPVGMNAPWPETHPSHHAELASKLTYEHDGKKIFAPETYRRATVRPQVYAAYRAQLQQMSAHGVNYIRMIQHPIATEIEWEELGNYTDRQHMAQEMDRILETAEQHAFLIHWNLAIHYTFKKGVYHITGWDWIDDDGTRSYAYKKAFQLTEPISFFQHDSARIYYQERIRYILARWGYSPAIGSFELLSEISNIGAETDDGHSYYEQHPEIYAAWQTHIGNYIKSFYYGREHLLTASYSGPVHPDDWTYRTGTTFDWMSSNIYDFGTPDWNRFFIQLVSKQLVNELPSNPHVYTAKTDFPNWLPSTKPVFLAESEPIHALHNQAGERSSIELVRQIWYQAFSGFAGVLPWSAWYDTTHFHHYSSLRRWMDSLSIVGGSWHPGGSKLVRVGDMDTWQFFPEAARAMSSKGDRVGGMYLRRDDGNELVGCVSNHTVNYFTLSAAPTHWEFTPPRALLRKKYQTSRRNAVGVHTLQPGTYEVRYFLPSNPEQTLRIDVQQGPEIRLRFPTLGVTADDFLILFQIKRIEH